MLKNKDLNEKFGLSLKTLYNWSTSRPELYEFLKKSDDYFDKSRDLELILRAYEENISPTFAKDEIKFLVEMNYKDKPTNFFKTFPQNFLELCSKKLSSENKIILNILPKITTLSVIETYLLLDKIYNYQQKLKNNKSDMDMADFFEYTFRCFYLKKHTA